MAELPHFIKDLALILVVAGAVTLIFRRLKQPLILGYIVAGFLVSPHMPYTMSVVDQVDVETWADIGVTFLLFSLGLDFSFKKVLKMGMAPIIAAITIIFCMMMLGMGAGHEFGWSKMDCIFLGGMLAMSSTTIIYKAFDDLGFRQHRFAGLVMSVLILEDILAIVMMVMLSAVASGNSPDGGQMVFSVLRIGFFLILWFLVGLYLIPSVLRITRSLMSDETMLVMSLGLCCLMAWISTSVGFSSAFGAFVMGSILAETVEADKIIRVVNPVKDLFGTIFFVSVGMLVDPAILVRYALPIALLVATILIGQCLFGSLGYLLSGQSLKTAMQCGFSMAQIGEFAFIIASMGMSMGVISKFLYPVVVAVSVITTFLTPYMIRLAEPAYNTLERHLPRKWSRRLDHLGEAHQSTRQETGLWKRLIRKMAINTVVYSILSLAAMMLMLTFFLPFARHILPHWWANGVTGLLTLALIAPFLRPLIMKNTRSEEFKALWVESRMNRLPLIFTFIVRVIIAAAFLFYICNYLARFANAFVITLALVIIMLMMFSRGLKQRSIRLERRFIQNLRSREIYAQVHGRQRPQYAGKLLDRDIHISDFEIPENSTWVGQTLGMLRLRNRFGVHVTSILRGSRRINIPSGDTLVFPSDHLQVIGSDEQLHAFGFALRKELVVEDLQVERREMVLQKIILSAGSKFLGLSLEESGIRDDYNVMVVGLEEGQQNLCMINPDHQFKQGDILWVVGEQGSLRKLDAVS